MKKGYRLLYIPGLVYGQGCGERKVKSDKLSAVNSLQHSLALPLPCPPLLSVHPCSSWATGPGKEETPTR